MTSKSMTEFMDPTAARIVLTANRGDSINRIANKIDVAYSWVYDWIDRLDEAKIISKTDNGIQITDHELRRQYDSLMATFYRRDTTSQEDAYVIPHFAGMEFAYTEIDAAFVWTHGGYQIARSHDDYPVFIKVHDRDIDRWIAFFERYGFQSTIGERAHPDDVDESVYYVLFPSEEAFEVAWVGGDPVIPLDEAIEKMTQHRPAYEPALEIIADEYDVDVEARHHEPATAD